MVNESLGISFLVCVYVWKCDEGFLFIFCIKPLRVLLLFQNKCTNIRRSEQKILNKYNKFWVKHETDQY